MRQKWKVRRGWIKVHISVDDQNKQVVGIEATDESISDTKEFGNLIDPRKGYAREFRELGYEGWRDRYKYGKRWYSEGTFSAVKRKFGEFVRAAIRIYCKESLIVQHSTLIKKKFNSAEIIVPFILPLSSFPL